MKKIVFFDLETGGLNWFPHQIGVRTIQMNPIIQIAAIAFDADTMMEVEAFEKKLCFDVQDCEMSALEVNHYDEKVWAESAIDPYDAKMEFNFFLKRHATVTKLSKMGRPYAVAQLAGHNASGFDKPFINAWFKQTGMFLPADFFVMDTLQTAMVFSAVTGRVFKDMKLATLAAHFGVQQDNAHDALDDVRTTARIFKAMIDELKSGQEVF